jgi:diguanylate cyclase (GGDEF)-like protein/PAS domain S-box-containing protein
METFFDLFTRSFKRSKSILLVVDPMDGTIVHVNDSAAVFYGQTKDLLAGTTLASLCVCNCDTLGREIMKCAEVDGHSFLTRQLSGASKTKDVEINSLPLQKGKKRLVALIVNDLSEKKTVDEMFYESEEKFRTLLQDIPSISVQGYRSDGTTFYWNKASEQLYGYTAEEAIGRNLVDLIIPPHMRTMVSELTQQMANTGVPPEASELELRHKNGSPVQVFSSHALVRLAHREDELFCIDIDISERKIAERLRLAANVFTHAVEPILITDADAQIIDANDAFIQSFGYSKDELIGQNPRILKSGKQDKQHYEQMWDTLLRDGAWSGEIWNKKKNGELYPGLIRINTVRDAQGKVQNYVGFFTDITHIKKHEEELGKAAYFDALTGLPNRVLLYDKLRSALRQGERRKELVALVYIDLDGFKKINDTYGHATGDEFLIEVSHEMNRQLRDGDTLARVGGDEFVAVLSSISSFEDCLRIIERLLDAAKQTITLGDKAVQASASIGVAIYPTDTDNPDLLMRKADKAMYKAKEAGKNTYSLATEDEPQF